MKQKVAIGLIDMADANIAKARKEAAAGVEQCFTVTVIIKTTTAYGLTEAKVRSQIHKRLTKGWSLLEGVANHGKVEISMP